MLSNAGLIMQIEDVKVNHWLTNSCIKRQINERFQNLYRTITNNYKQQKGAGGLSIARYYPQFGKYRPSMTIYIRLNRSLTVIRRGCHKWGGTPHL